jgi:osmoprotectant transport system ATP-binding protein
VARALAIDPPVLLMDEPFGALDPITRAELHGEFRRIQQQVRKTIVIVTHDMREAFALADRIGVLDDGRLIALDTASALGASVDPVVKLFVDSCGADVAAPAPERRRFPAQPVA